MHKLTKIFLRLWIALTSIAAFAFGWVFLAHSQKPEPLVVPEVEIFTSSQANLEPILSLNDLVQTELSSSMTVQSPSITFPRLRTRGS